MTKFSGTKRRPLRGSLKAPVRTMSQRAATYEGGCRLRAGPGVGAVPAGRHEHGRRGHLLRARRRPRRSVCGPRAPGDRIEPGVHRRHGARGSRVGLAQYLRETLLMRSAAIVMAAEYVAAGGSGGRSVVARAAPATRRAGRDPRLLDG